MAVFWVVAVCLSVTLATVRALPVDPRKPGGGEAVPVPGNVYGDPARFRRTGEVPGLDKDEYNRYWQEMARANPGKSLGCVCVCGYM